MNNYENIFNQNLLDKLGVVDWGYTESYIPASLKNYNDWISRGDQGVLTYLTGERQNKRQNLKNYFNQYQSAMVFLFDYGRIKKSLKSFENSKLNNGMKISPYVLGFEGLDYHFTLRERLNELSEFLKSQSSGLETVFSLDTQPILERDLAYKSGLGWFGKNSMLINRKHGSNFIIGSLLLNKKLEIAPTSLESDHCGNCTACIDACPTNAIDEVNRTLFADKCISTWTIEVFKDSIEAPEGMRNSNGEIFGCDICQDVCPWNNPKKFLFNFELPEKAREIVDFFMLRPKNEIIEDLSSMSNKSFKRNFKGTPLERTGRIGILKNIKFYLNNIFKS